MPEEQRDVSVADLLRLGEEFAVLARAGERKLLVLLVADLSPAAVAVYLHCLRAGHRVMLLDPRLGPERRHQVLRGFRPDVVLLPSNGHLVPPQDMPDHLPLGTVGTALLLRRERFGDPLDHRHLAVLIATSGSLGAFRFVCLTYSGLRHNAEAIVGALGLHREDRAAWYLSMAYSYGLSVLNSHLVAGGSVAIMRQPPTNADHWGEFDAARCTTTAAVPETYRLLHAVGHDFAAHPTLRLATQAGGRLPEPLVVAHATALTDSGRQLAVMYGQTEATARITCHTGADVLRHPLSVGRPIAGVDVAVEDDDGRPAPSGTVGQITVSGPGTMLGYAERREDLDELPCHGLPLLRTGDLGRLKDGRLYVTGRLARIAKCTGVRVALDEVEEFFTRIGPAAVVCDDERIVVYVEGPVTAFRAAYREVLRTYLVPPAMVRLRSIGTIPRTMSGKIAYRELPSRPEPTRR